MDDRLTIVYQVSHATGTVSNRSAVFYEIIYGLEYFRSRLRSGFEYPSYFNSFSKRIPGQSASMRSQ
jgi:hypothetical protein